MRLGLLISFGVSCAITYPIKSSSAAAESADDTADATVAESELKPKEGESTKEARARRQSPARPKPARTATARQDGRTGGGVAPRALGRRTPAGKAPPGVPRAAMPRRRRARG